MYQIQKKTVPYKATAAYFKDNISLVTRLEQGYIQNLKNVHKTLLITKGFKKFIFYIQDKYPNIKLKLVKDTKTALQLVADSKAFGYIGTSLTSSYIIQKEFASKLKIVNSFKDIYFGFGVVEDDKILKDVLNKAIQATTQNEKNKIFNKWIATTIQKDIDYTWVWQLLTVIAIIFLFTIYKNILSAKHNTELKKRIQEAIEQNNRQNQQMIQQSRLAQMGEMISMIAHQWRQPLGAITARTGAISLQLMLKKDIDPEKLQKELSKINDYAQHLSNTINDFRDFFKNNKQLEITTIESIVQSTLDIIQISIENKNIKIITKFECNKKFEVLPNEVKQVILNILKNAEDVLLEKDITNPTITIHSTCNENQVNPVLYVEDNAGGITEDIMDKIFDPYFSTKSAKNGTGLGLYMSKTIIDDHCKGTLSVSNGKNGAIFKIDFNKKNIRK